MLKHDSAARRRLKAQIIIMLIPRSTDDLCQHAIAKGREHAWSKRLKRGQAPNFVVRRSDLLYIYAGQLIFKQTTPQISVRSFLPAVICANTRLRLHARVGGIPTHIVI